MNEKTVHNFYQVFPLSVYICTNHRHYCLKENDKVLAQILQSKGSFRGMVIFVSKTFHRYRKLADSWKPIPLSYFNVYSRFSIKIMAKTGYKISAQYPQVLKSSQFQFNFPYLLLFKDSNDQREKAAYENSCSLSLSSARRNLEELGRQMLCIPSAV